MSAEIVQIVRRWGNSKDEDVISDAQATISMIVARVQPRDDSWFILTSDALGVPESVLRDYAAYGDSLSLAILIHITRQQFLHYWKWYWPTFGFSEVLEAASKFNVRDTTPELQHGFCALWNHIVLKAQDDDNETIARYVLGPIRNIHVALHQGTGSAPTRSSTSTSDLGPILSQPSSYPLCNVPDHHPDLTCLTAHVHNDSAFTTCAPVVLRNNTSLPPASLTSPDALSLSIPAPRHVGEGLTDVPPLDDDLNASRPFHSAHQTATDDLRIPASSRDPVTACVAQGSIGTTIPLSTPKPSAFTPPTSMVLASPPGAAAVQHIADRRTSLDVPDIPSLPSSTPVLDDMRPTGLQSPLHTLVTKSNHVSSPESHSSLPAPATPSLSRQLSSALYLGTSTEGEGSAKGALHKERDALGSPPMIRENMIAAPGVPPTDVAIAGPLWRNLGAENRPPYPSHDHYDIV
ncbi:hypothetical protein EDB87DRAFT_1693802 [Lactarius vividus]|nr:hypothetical protein EDB87DRAFT_1693802 [Lactarius vividus]